MTREESYRCVQRRDSMICIAFFCIIVLGVALTMPFVAQGQTSHVEQSDQFVCVQAGDTLWSIGAEYCDRDSPWLRACIGSLTTTAFRQALSCRVKLSKFRLSEVMRSRAMGYA